MHTTSSISAADGRGQQQQQQAQQSRGPLPFTAESGVTLQDLTALLSESHQLPPNMGSHIHGVTHHGGLLVHTLQGSDLTNQPHPHHPTHHPVTRQDVSDPQAVLIRPPQQSSRPSHNISGVSTSDISHSESSLSLQQDAAQWGQLFAQHDGEGDSVRSEESHRRQNFSSDRMLELRDLEVEPQVRRPDDMLMVSTRRGQGASREEASLMERSVAGEWHIVGVGDLEADVHVLLSVLLVNANVVCSQVHVTMICFTLFIASNFRGINLSGPSNFQCWGRKTDAPTK